MEKRLWSFLAACFMAFGVAFAQQKTVTGVVVESETGEPVIGASVVVKGLSGVGAATDVDGRFTIKDIPNSATTLMVSYIGMRTKEVAIKPNLKITLDSESLGLNDVVVTAMGIKRSVKALGYSATQVKAEDITETRTNDIMSGLAGKIAGVQISSTSSDPGSSNSVVIRGFSSLTGTNQPLYVVDGVPLNNSAFFSNSGLDSGFDFGNGANAVSPDDVESMTVLKGAAATALYGSRAANGVVLITTKTGKKANKGFGIEYNGGTTWESVLRVPQMQNMFGMGWYGDKTDDENGSWGPRFDGATLKYGTIYNNSQLIKSYVPIKNNVKDFFDTGFKYENSVSFNGASDDNRSNYFVSLSQIHEDGIVPTDADSYKKYTFSARGSHKVKDFTISTSLNYAFQQNSFVTTGQSSNSTMYNAVMQTPRDISIADLKDLSDPFNTPGYYYTPYGITNPYWIIENFENKFESERFYGKFQLDYDFLKYFKATYRFGLDTTTSHHNMGEPNMNVLFAGTANGDYGAFDSNTGYVSHQTSRTREINQDLFVTYDQQINNDWHVNAIAGLNGNERKYSYLFGSVTGLTIPTWYNLSNSSEIPNISQYMSLRRLMGVYAQAEVGYKDLAFVTVTARDDWSSTLPKGNRSFFYPGITGSFVFSELFNADLKNVISFGKFRAAWGKTGNDAAPYMTSSVYGQASASSSYWGTSSFPFAKTGTNAYTVGNTLGSVNLSPEMTTESELGLNMAFFNNRISFDFAYYNRLTDKQIFSLSMDPASGYTYQNMNLGEIRNRGLELLVNVTPVKTKDIQWDLSFNWTKNWNKVISLPEELGGESVIYGFGGGTCLYAIAGEELGIFKAYTSQKTEDGQIIVDENGLPVITDDIVKIGSMNHKYQLGFGTKIRYKSFSFSADFDYRHGGLMYSRTRNILNFTGNSIESAYNDRNPWVVPNSVVATPDGYVPNTTPLTPTNIYNYWNNGGINRDAGDLIDKTYLKLRSITLSWDMPKKWLLNTFLSDVRLSLFGSNLFVWTPKSNPYIDPELTSFGNDLEGNFGEYSANPSSRKFGFNVQVKF
ncbi:MAG: SusC/RagA family TonB-linked outer membrane protein [Prevotellaceae bacterium]|nr:SusC/RagA family TonB-linked outer membrane protein [Prevotellaceae bacterium]